MNGAQVVLHLMVKQDLLTQGKSRGVVDNPSFVASSSSFSFWLHQPQPFLPYILYLHFYEAVPSSSLGVDMRLTGKISIFYPPLCHRDGCRNSHMTYAYSIRAFRSEKKKKWKRNLISLLYLLSWQMRSKCSWWSSFPYEGGVSGRWSQCRRTWSQEDGDLQSLKDVVWDSRFSHTRSQLLLDFSIYVHQ